MKRLVLMNLAPAPGENAWSVRLKLNRTAGILFCLCVLSGICAPPLFAQSDNAADGVTVKVGKVYNLQGGRLVELTDDEKLPFDVEVSTNGTFTVAAGKERMIEEGQIIRRDGWLVNPDGSVQPVFDHVAMLAGRVVVVRDGQSTPLATAMTFPSGLVIQPDGTCAYTKSGGERLQDGQLFRMDGTGITAKDTATFKNGVVVLQRGGAIIRLQPNQIMGMNEGSKVYGNGQVQPRDGPATKMVEGQMVLFDGAPAKN